VAATILILFVARAKSDVWPVQTPPPPLNFSPQILTIPTTRPHMGWELGACVSVPTRSYSTAHTTGKFGVKRLLHGGTHFEEPCRGSPAWRTDRTTFSKAAVSNKTQTFTPCVTINC